MLFQPAVSSSASTVRTVPAPADQMPFVHVAEKTVRPMPKSTPTTPTKKERRDLEQFTHPDAPDFPFFDLDEDDDGE